LDIIFVLPVVVLLSLVAGVFNRLNGVSLSVVLIPGLLGFSNLVSLDSKDVLLILIATCLSASIPLSVMYFVRAAKYNRDLSSVLAKTAARIALLSILFSQVLGIVPALYVQYLYWFVLVLLLLGLVYKVMANSVGWGSGFRLKKLPSNLYYSGLMSVSIGGIGSEWRGVFAGRDEAVDRLDGFAFLSVFIALPACLGFMFPGLPVSLIEQNPNLSAWMMGYICWPVSIVIFMSASLGQLLVRQHKNETDIVWLNFILVFYLFASALRLIVP